MMSNSTFELDGLEFHLEKVIFIFENFIFRQMTNDSHQLLFSIDNIWLFTQRKKVTNELNFSKLSRDSHGNIRNGHTQIDNI